MGRIYTNLKRIFEKASREGTQEIYQDLLQKFVTIITYEDTYLMKKMNKYFVLRQNGVDMFIDCGGFGIVVDKQDNISVHT